MAKFSIACPICNRINQPEKFLFFNNRNIKCAGGETFDVNAARMASRECPKCKTVTFPCPQCNCTLLADKSARNYECPICNFDIDVQKEIAKTELQKDGKVSVIKYEGDNKTLVWKHPIEDFAMGSQLIVHESQEALFFRDGQALDLFPSGRHTLETQKLPVISKIYKLPTEPEGVFHSEILLSEDNKKY